MSIKLFLQMLANFFRSTSKKNEPKELPPSNTSVSIESSVKMNKRPVSTVEEAIARYGTINNNKWKDEYKWMVLFQTPDWFVANVKGMDGNPCKRIYMNKDMVKPFEDALKNISDRKLEDELKTFDGCFNIRMIRGTTDKPSTHTYGVGIDLNAGENPLGHQGLFTEELGKCFEDAGFTWGRRWKRQDSMHFEFSWG